MRGYFQYLAERWQLSIKGIGGFCGWVSLIVGAAMAVLVWLAPNWTRAHISDRVNVFVLGLIPLLAGGSVFFTRWLLSVYWVYEDVCRERDKLKIITEDRENAEKANERKEAIILQLSRLMDRGEEILFETRALKANQELQDKADKWFVTTQNVVSASLGETALAWLRATGVAAPDDAPDPKYFWEAYSLHVAMHTRMHRLRELIERLQLGKGVEQKGVKH